MYRQLACFLVVHDIDTKYIISICDSLLSQYYVVPMCDYQHSIKIIRNYGQIMSSYSSCYAII
jgi:hypothetical protein